jgi:hypothetical protein
MTNKARKTIKDNINVKKAELCLSELQNQPAKKTWKKNYWGSICNNVDPSHIADCKTLFQVDKENENTLYSTYPLNRELTTAILKGEKPIYVHDGSHYYFISLSCDQLSKSHQSICDELFSINHLVISDNIKCKVDELVQKKQSGPLSTLHDGYNQLIKEINNFYPLYIKSL